MTYQLFAGAGNFKFLLYFACQIHNSYIVLLWFHIISGLDHDLRSIYSSVNYREVTEVHVHPEFKPPRIRANDEENVYLKNDIALFKLTIPFEFGERTNIYPICLINQKKYVFENDLHAASWGLTESENVTKVNKKVIGKRMTDNQSVQVINDNTKLMAAKFKQASQSDYASFNLSYSDFIIASSKSSSFCTFDKGAPLITNIDNRFYAVGILVSMWSTQDSDHIYRCYPGTFSFSIPIYNYLNWIKSNVGDNLCMG